MIKISELSFLTTDKDLLDHEANGAK
jgi:hypothetical protein